MLLGAARAGDVLIVDAVEAELAAQLPDLVSLFHKEAPRWVQATSADLGIQSDLNKLEMDLNQGNLLRGDYPKQNIRKYMMVADPVLVLHAQRYQHVVVSKELSDVNSKKSPKLPDLCRHFGVQHASPDAFARVLGQQFTFGAVARSP